MTASRTYPEQPPEKVYFYGTCLVDLFYPEAGLAGIDLLERAGVEVLYPEDQSCCGQPAWNSGYDEEARTVARAQMALFPEPWPIVVPSASCAGMMRHHYPLLFEGQPEVATLPAFTGRVYELTEFLVHVLKLQLKDKGEPVSVVLHNSCKAQREMHSADTAHALLAQLENVAVRHQARASECCGFGGTFSVKVPEVSGAMVQDKVEALTATGADCLLSGDCGCMMNITGAAQKQGKRLPGKHIATFLWERTR